MERERGGAEEAVGEEAVEGQDLHLHVLVTVDRRRYRPREPLRGEEEDKQGTVMVTGQVLGGPINSELRSLMGNI